MRGNDTSNRKFAKTKGTLALLAVKNTWEDPEGCEKQLAGKKLAMCVIPGASAVCGWFAEVLDLMCTLRFPLGCILAAMLGTVEVSAAVASHAVPRRLAVLSEAGQASCKEADDNPDCMNLEIWNPKNKLPVNK